MKRAYAASFLALGLAGCGTTGSGPYDDGWTTLIDGTSMSGVHAIQAANWHPADGAIVADKGIGFLMTDREYGDFQIHAEFYAEADTNSGVFLRCSDDQKPDSKVCYEVNIWDMRPAPEYGTGAIVDVAKVVPMPKAGGKWNTYDITAKGSEFTVILNGIKTVDGVKNDKLAKGRIALQYGGGIVRFRKVEVRPL